MIINGKGHWGWLMITILNHYPDIVKAYETYPALNGFMFARKIFHNNAEIIIIERTSEKVYKLVMYRGNKIEHTSCNKALDVCEYLKEKLSENPFIKG